MKPYARRGKDEIDFPTTKSIKKRMKKLGKTWMRRRPIEKITTYH